MSETAKVYKDEWPSVHVECDRLRVLVAELTAERDALRAALSALETWDPLECTQCGQWEDSDVIAKGVHGTMVNMLRAAIASVPANRLVIGAGGTTGNAEVMR